MPSTLEIIAVVLAVLYLILAAYQSIWCWLAAGVSSLIYIKICYDSQLFIETGLQFFYFVMAVVGYYNWQKIDTKSEEQSSIQSISKKNLYLGISICSVISIAAAYWFEQNSTAKLPWLDAPVTIFSVWATWLVIKKVIENWILWVIIDAVAIYIYLNRELHLTAVLYAVYTVLAIVGYLKWKKQYNQFVKLPL